MSRWPMVPLGEVLTQVARREAVDPTKEYSLLGVRLEGSGPFLRERITGSQSAANYLFRVEAGDFVYSRLFAWRGAFGVIPKELAGGYVSNEFPTFTADPHRLDVKYLNYWFRLKPTIGAVAENCTGSTPLTRNRFNEDFFRALRIPLPPLPEQRRLVERIDALAAKIEEAKRLRGQADQEGSRLLISMAHRLELSSDDKRKAGWREVSLGAVIRLSLHAVPVETSGSYPNLGIFSFGRGLFPKPPIDGLATSARTLFRVHPGQFIYSRLFAFEGAYGIVTGEYDGHFVSNEYPTFDLDSDQIHPAFLHAYFKAPRIWTEIATGSKGLGDRRQRVHPEQVLAHRLYLPPLDWQHHIAAIQMKLDGEENNRQAVGTELDAMLPAILDRAFKGNL